MQLKTIRYKKMNRQFKELLRYIICGGVTTVINLVLFYILTKWGHFYYLLANIIGYYCAVLINFWLNWKWVFKNEEQKSTSHKLIEFVKLRSASLVADTGLFFVLVSILKCPLYPSRIGLSAVIILINYIWSKYKIF